MNTEIKYRAWDKLKKCWVVKDTGMNEMLLHINPILVYCVDNAGVDETPSGYMSENIIISQSIGVYDATKWNELSEKEKKTWIEKGNTYSEWKGKEIYERDLLEIPKEHFAYEEYKDQKIQEVVFRGGSYQLIREQIGWEGELLIIIKHECKIVGNVFENPELINAK